MRESERLRGSDGGRRLEFLDEVGRERGFRCSASIEYVLPRQSRSSNGRST